MIILGNDHSLGDEQNHETSCELFTAPHFALRFESKRITPTSFSPFTVLCSHAVSLDHSYKVLHLLLCLMCSQHWFKTSEYLSSHSLLPFLLYSSLLTLPTNLSFADFINLLPHAVRRDARFTRRSILLKHHWM